MGSKTAISWSDATWNPTTGCDRVSPGCDNCYAERTSTRFGLPFLGALELHEDRLDIPLRWRTPRRVFVNSMSDLFHPDVPVEFLARVFAVMTIAPQHTFQVLTKRPQRMQKILGEGTAFESAVWQAVDDLVQDRDNRLSPQVRQNQRSRANAWMPPAKWPLPNVWLGTSVESQTYAKMRVEHLLATPAAVRFVSAEPLLGPLNLREWLPGYVDRVSRRGRSAQVETLDWVIIGGESQRGARKMDVDWALDLVSQCQFAKVPVHVKQLGSVHGRDHQKIETFPLGLQFREWPGMPDAPNRVVQTFDQSVLPVEVVRDIVRGIDLEES